LKFCLPAFLGIFGSPKIQNFNHLKVTFIYLQILILAYKFLVGGFFLPFVTWKLFIRPMTGIRG
jgi:hypothetical protein